MSVGRALAIDVAAVVSVGAAACLEARSPARMAVVVATAYAARLLAWRRLPASARPLPMGRETLFLGGCALLGACNDWNTVVRHGVYRYGVPSDLDPFSSIPLWMLAYWGLILRLVTTLALDARLGRTGPAHVVRGVRAPPPVLRVMALLALVLATRQAIYRTWADPWLSWLPFAVALGIHPLLFPWGRRERRLAAIAAVAGPLAEAALIQVGGVHAYALGWLGGVPLWIALWWVLAVLIWGELSRELVVRLASTAVGVPGAR